MMAFRQIRALVLVASALALASRAAFPVHMLLPGADGIVYMALCTATGIKQVPVRKGSAGQEQSAGIQGCAHSLCAASLHVSSAVRLTQVVWQVLPLVDMPGSVAVSVVSDFAYARGPPFGRVLTPDFSGAVCLERAALFYGCRTKFFPHLVHGALGGALAGA
jgi:hypothetical protein